MYTVKKELPADRAARSRRNRDKEQYTEEYVTNGVNRIRIFHPTKGIRDRNKDRMLVCAR